MVTRRSVLSWVGAAGMYTMAARKGLAVAIKTMVLEDRAGLKWEFLRKQNGWVLGTISFHEKQVEQPATKGLLALRNLKSGEVRWLAAAQAEKINPHTAHLSGQEEIEGVKLSWEMDVALCEDLPAARFTPRWSVDKRPRRLGGLPGISRWSSRTTGACRAILGPATAKRYPLRRCATAACLARWSTARTSRWCSCSPSTAIRTT